VDQRLLNVLDRLLLNQRLLNQRLLDQRLLDIRLGKDRLDDLGLRLVDNLFGDWNVFYLFNLSLLWYVFGSISGFRNIFSVGSLNRDLFDIRSLLWNVFSDSLVVNLRNIFSLVFNSVVISELSGDWNLFDDLFCFIVSVGSLNWNVFSSCDLFIILVFSGEWDLFDV